MAGASEIPWAKQYLAGILATVIFLVLTLPAIAGARAGYIVHPGGLELILPVEERANYVISISANERKRVQLAINRFSSEINYSTIGHVSNHQINAKFGAMGQINVQLHLVPFRPGPTHDGRCKGRAPVYREGRYDGIIEFSDARLDAPIVSTKHGRAYFVRRFRQICKRRHSQPISTGPWRRSELGRLTTSGKVKGRTIKLQAFILMSGEKLMHSKGYVSTTVSERLETVRVVQRADVSIDHHTFTLSPRGMVPRTAELAPAAPFAGRALYSSSPTAPSQWTGDLSINLPGIGTLPLTGLGFKTALCRGLSVSTLRHCF